MLESNTFWTDASTVIGNVDSPKKAVAVNHTEDFTTAEGQKPKERLGEQKHVSCVYCMSLIGFSLVLTSTRAHLHLHYMHSL